MHLHKFNICSLMCLSFSNISSGSQWTDPRSLQINKRTHIATGTYNNYMSYQSLLQHASCLWLTFFLKQWLCHIKQHKEFYFPWSCSSNSELGTHITTGRTRTPYKCTQHIICTLLHHSQKDLKYLDKLHWHSLFLHNSLLKLCHKFLFYVSYKT